MKLDDLIAMSDKLFSEQRIVACMWQIIAEHFRPQRADFFTSKHTYGQHFADNLLNSYPVLVCRDLGDSFSAMLRDGHDWFKIWTIEEPDYAGKQWLENRSDKLQRLFADHNSNFVRATKEADYDFATFGQCVMSIEPNRNYNGLLFRTWHLRDCAWADDENGQVGPLHRKWFPTLYDLVRLFGDKLHESDRRDRDREPFKTKEIRHICMPSWQYGKGEFERFDYVSIYLDVEHKRILEETGQHHHTYIVPRFQTLSGTPYAFSPATAVALPNARLLQTMTFTLMEAAERYARPPMLATEQAVRSDVDFGPDGITWIDKEYDERSGEALRPMRQDRGGWPVGKEMAAGVEEILFRAFYQNRINLPDVTREMTAYEVQERMKQFRRENLPLFQPIEQEYSSQLCESSLKLALNMGLMGRMDEIPRSIRGADIDWKFESPLSQAEEDLKVHQYQQAVDMLVAGGQIDPSMVNEVDMRQALRDAI